MQQIQIFQIDAFTDTLFKGNPAAVCPLKTWLDDEVMQQIAAENNLAETAFFVPSKQGYEIRWFTPTCEVPLCGHATLASAYVLFEELKAVTGEVRFDSKSGPLKVSYSDGRFTLDFPVNPTQQLEVIPEALIQALGEEPSSVIYVEGGQPTYFAIFEREEQVTALAPDMAQLTQLHPFSVAVSAPGKDVDCISRYFLPSYGIPEDPVTGMIHCSLAPYWSQRLGKKEIHAYQASERGGYLNCLFNGERVLLSGHAKKYLQGVIEV